MWLLTLALFLVLIGLIYIFLIWNFKHWQNRGVYTPKPLPFLGNYPSIISQKQHMANDIDDIYRACKKDNDFVGIFRCRGPQLLILSPTLVRRILVTDFTHFHDNELSQMVDEKSDFTLANNPFSLTGDEWKERRAEITPALTMSRTKTVYPVTQKICTKLSEYIRRQIRVAPKDGTDAKDLCLRFTSEVVADCIMGLDADSFTESPALLARIKQIFEQSFTSILYFTVVIGLLPSLKNFFKATFVPKALEKYFVELMQKAIDLRKSNTAHRDRVDYLNYMLQLQEKKQISTRHITANMMTFLLDGFETTGTVIAHCLLLLARTPEVQSKLRAEIQEHLDKNGEIDFDTLNELPYLDACIHESIRVFPPGFFSSKICTQPIEITNQKNGRSVKIVKGDLVMLPLYSIMLDEEYYPNAYEFQPERFLEENGGVKKYREKGVYYGFSDGPRVCLGMRFALAQSKAAIVEVIKNFVVIPNAKTRKDNRLDPTYFLTQIDGGIWLDFEAVN